MQAAFVKVAEARRVTVAQRMTESETQVTKPAGIGVVFTDSQFGRLGDEAIDHVGRLMLSGAKNGNMIRLMLVGLMGIDQETGLEAVVTGHMRQGGPWAISRKKLGIETVKSYV